MSLKIDRMCILNTLWLTCILMKSIQEPRFWQALVGYDQFSDINHLNHRPLPVTYDHNLEVTRD